MDMNKQNRTIIKEGQELIIGDGVFKYRGGYNIVLVESLAGKFTIDKVVKVDKSEQEKFIEFCKKMGVGLSRTTSDYKFCEFILENKELIKSDYRKSFELLTFYLLKND